MEVLASLIPCCCQMLKLTIDKMVGLEVKLKESDLTINEDIKQLVENIQKYRKKDRKKIIEYIHRTLELNVSMVTNANTAVNTVVHNSVVEADTKDN